MEHPSLHNIKVVPIGDNLYDIYRVNNSITNLNYIGQVSADHIGYGIKDSISGEEETVQWTAEVIYYGENRKYCIRLLTGQE